MSAAISIEGLPKMFQKCLPPAISLEYIFGQIGMRKGVKYVCLRSQNNFDIMQF